MSRADLVARLEQVDAALVKAGFPALSPFWRETFRAFLSGRKRTLVVRAGRRGGKSSSCARLAVVVALFGEHVIPPGDLGIVAFISASRDEAANRLRMIKAILDALRVKYTERGDTIELAHRPIAFQVFTASIAGVSGPTCIVVFADEVAKWRDKDTGANPAKEVLASVRATMATQPEAFMVMISSPWSTLDAHHEAFARGDTADQSVAFAPTWIANPTISEEETHRLEPDPATHAREYAAEPMSSGASSWFSHDAIDAAVDPALTIPSRIAGAVHYAGIDTAWRKDSAANAIVGARAGMFHLAALYTRTPMPGAPLVPGDVIRDFASSARSFGAATMASDAYYIETTREQAGMVVIEIPAGIGGKQIVFGKARELLHSGRLRLPSNVPRLVRGLKEIVGKPTSGGQIQISAPRRAGNHADDVSALVAALWAASEGPHEILLSSEVAGRLRGRDDEPNPEDDDHHGDRIDWHTY